MGRIKLNFFDKFILVGALVVALLLLLSYRAGSANPNQHIYLAFLGLAYPYLLLVHLGFTAYWVLRGKIFFWVTAVVIVFCGIRPLTASFALMGDEGTAEKQHEEHLRVMTYNVHTFTRYGEALDAEVKSQMLQVVKDQNPDVISFQEFYTRPKGKFAILDTLKKQMGFKYHYFVPSAKNDFEAYGMAIFSKYPINQTGVIAFGSSFLGEQSIYADVKFKGRVVRIYNVHLQSISFVKQDYDYLDKVKSGDVAKAPSRRIAGMLKSAFQKRADQVNIVKDSLAQCKIPYVIMGDFNDTPASYAVTQIMGPLNNTFKKKGRGWGKTYNGKFPNFQIDYIACTKKIEVVNYHITQAKLSDHFPVRSDLKLNYE